ncbi:hypothetical protein [Amycolatopsis alkalitolerans]|uniref:hypothetical protein n=1 Tax=Amycolatopsis alkalitolerans TaxID=2547244 RepID=UPI00190F78FE|nr:hypothetical protein [Amycolatopsis alkalitolerans]
MAEDQDKKQKRNPEPPLGPNFPRLHHPDLDPDKTDEVEGVPNRDEVHTEEPVPEPPD